jgi:hypothetical protein
LSSLNYRWGDAIDGIVITLLKAGWKSPFRSVCVLATGETAQAIRPLFEQNWAFGRFGVELFEDEKKAVAYLKQHV